MFRGFEEGDALESSYRDRARDAVREYWLQRTAWERSEIDQAEDTLYALRDIAMLNAADVSPELFAEMHAMFERLERWSNTLEQERAGFEAGGAGPAEAAVDADPGQEALGRQSPLEL